MRSGPKLVHTGLGLLLGLCIPACAAQPATTTQASSGSSSTGDTSVVPTTDGPTPDLPSDTTGESCPPDRAMCGSWCANLNSDPDHCGTCDSPCPDDTVCMQGTCAPDCGDLTACDGGCFNTAVDPTHCGSCGNLCPAGEVCAQGTCTPGCGDGQTICGGACSDIFHDPQNCGNCGETCPPPPNNGEAACIVPGTCTFKCLQFNHPAPPLDPVDCEACTDDPVLAAGPIHYWRFSEQNGSVAIDDIGGADATYLDVTLDQEGVLAPNDRAALFGTAETSEARIDSMSFPATAVTVEVVVRIDDAEQPVHPFISVASGNGSEANEFLFYHRVGDEGNQGLRLIVAQTHEWRTALRVDDGNWHHLAASWSNDNGATIYVDGQRMAHQPTLGDAQSITAMATVIFGQEQDLLGGGFDPTQYLKGALDSLVIFDRVLTDQEVFVHATSVMCSGS